jgi:acetolactate synthase-1/2/3 large subunit
MATLRGADILVRALAQGGTQHLFSLSGNQIMPVYDAALDMGLSITHVRHEGAAVHMADAWGRLTGEPGVALLTGGPGHANGIGALYTALASESPLVMLSGHAPLQELGRGAFQEMAQAELAAPVTKAAWTAQSAGGLAGDIARAMRIARSGRPGPVHVSLPFDVLEARVDGEGASCATLAFGAQTQALDATVARSVVVEIAKARRPLILTGPLLASSRGEKLRAELCEASGAPVVPMESPRGVNDPCLGAFADVLKQADLIVLLGKQPDFTLRFGVPPAVDAACRFVVIDPDVTVMRRSCEILGGTQRVAVAAVADATDAARMLCGQTKRPASTAWRDEVEAAVAFRPAEWATVASAAGASVHPLEVGRAVQRVLAGSRDAVLVADGGEFGQWAQACVSAPTRLINGPAGSIGSAIPFALAARIARPQATVVAMLGDGTCGFHLAEFDTAVRARLPFVAVVGNDGCWNAEYQIQLRAYGRERARGCELRPARYEQAVAALGGHGEHVDHAHELGPALARAAGSDLPACVNVMIERLPAPTVARAPAATAH